MNNEDYKNWAVTKEPSSYKETAERLFYSKDNLRLMHSVLGIAGESGELTDCVKKTLLYGKQLDLQHVKEEAGDILWYMSILLDTIGSSFDEVMQLNHDKLEKRYPSGFTEKAAVERADKV